MEHLICWKMMPRHMWSFTMCQSAPRTGKKWDINCALKESIGIGRRTKTRSVLKTWAAKMTITHATQISQPPPEEGLTEPLAVEMSTMM